MPSYYKVKAQKKYGGGPGGGGGDGGEASDDGTTAGIIGEGAISASDAASDATDDGTTAGIIGAGAVGPGDGDSAGAAGGPNDDVIVKYTGPLANDKVATRATSAENFIAIPKSTYMTSLATQKAITPENIFTVYNPKATTGGK
jgi:hypothetical protein